MKLRKVFENVSWGRIRIGVLFGLAALFLTLWCAGLLPWPDAQTFARMSPGDWGSWVGALGTVGAFVAVVHELKTDHRLRREEHEVAQARLVSAWLCADETDDPNRQQAITVLNGSSEPVYEVVVNLVRRSFGDGRDVDPHFYRDHIVLAPPGKTMAAVCGGWGGMHFVPEIEVAFVDCSGVSWLRTAGGKLVKLSTRPGAYYNITEPAGWHY